MTTSDMSSGKELYMLEPGIHSRSYGLQKLYVAARQASKRNMLFSLNPKILGLTAT